MRSLHNTYYLIHNTQRGFAPIALVVLLLFGIAAGTLLVQNGVNFLPKAQEDWDHPINSDQIVVRFEKNCYENQRGNRRNLQIRGGGYNVFQETVCDNISRPCYDGFKELCGAKNMQCYKENDFEGRCVNRQENPEGTPFLCTLDQVKSNSLSSCPNEQKLLISHCDRKGSSGKIIGHEDCSVLQAPSNYDYYCYWSKQCSNGQQSPTGPAVAPAAQPAAQPAAAGEIPWLTDKECNNAQKARCANTPSEPKEGCAVDYGGNGWCLYEARRNGEKCNDDTHGASCRKNYNGAECRIIDRVPRCVVKTCTAGDVAACGNNSTCKPGTKNYNGTDYSYTFCGPKTGTAPAGAPGTGPAPAAARPGANQGAPAGQSATTSAATGCEEFKDSNDLGIPCFKIGVFNPEDLEATEASARMASARYVEFTKILDEIKGKIGADIEKAARDRITAAEAAAKACLPNERKT